MRRGTPISPGPASRAGTSASARSFEAEHLHSLQTRWRCASAPDPQPPPQNRSTHASVTVGDRGVGFGSCPESDMGLPRAAAPSQLAALLLLDVSSDISLSRPAQAMPGWAGRDDG